MKLFRQLILTLSIFTATRAEAQVPELNSYPVAGPTVFLDFDGHYVDGTVWNWNGPIAAMPAQLTTRDIHEIFNRVAEDFRPFNLNVTTDSAKYWAAPYDQRIRIIVTSTSWFGWVGGVAFVGSFTWGDNSPAWVFSQLLYNNPKYVAEAISHETGHTLALQHQSTYDSSCNKTSEYNEGEGIGEIGWAPIMGVGYYENLTTWHRGQISIGCGYTQSDFDVITSYNNLTLRDDDHANDTASATAVNVYGGSFSVDGLINASSDVDAFRIVLPTSNHFTISAIPQNVGTDNEGANIDIKVWLINGSDTIGNYNPSTLLNAGVDTNLLAGTYYLVVDGVGNKFHSDYGSMGYYALNGMVQTVLGVNSLDLHGVSVAGPLHQFAWSFRTDEAVASLIIERAGKDGSFAKLVTLPGDATHFEYKPEEDGVQKYRLRVVTPSHPNGYLSNILSLSSKLTQAVRINTVAGSKGSLQVQSKLAVDWTVLSAGGQVLRKGKLNAGLNQLDLQLSSGLYFFRYTTANGVSAEKFIIQ